MIKVILGLGALVVTIAPIGAVVSCGNDTSSKPDVSKPTDKPTVPTKAKATYPENQEYFEKTGYDPKRPLSDYYDYNIKKNTYMSELYDSWKDKNGKEKLYEAKFEEQNVNMYFYLFGTPGDMTYIPYLEHYDFANWYEKEKNGYKYRLELLSFPYKSDLKK